MINVPLIDELRETRRRLSKEAQEDVARYAQMLQEVARVLPGTYVTNPILPQAGAAPEPASLEPTGPSGA